MTKLSGVGSLLLGWFGQLLDLAVGRGVPKCFLTLGHTTQGDVRVVLNNVLSLVLPLQRGSG